ncbi:MAG TPA: oxidoreductase, partial [Acidimicrobiaceae bacterium]|nr:oxidoreductase [Acidimicrobiaceae bacterium]
AEQASARGGEIGVQLVDDRVHLSGRAVTVVHGKLLA